MDHSPLGAEYCHFGAGFRVRAAALLALIMLLGAGVPTLNAQEEAAEQPTEEPKNADEKADAEKKGPSFIPIPIFVTEPDIGYRLGVR